MADAPDRTTVIQDHLERLRAGDAMARDALLAISMERMRRLAGKMLRGYPGVGRWEETDDVLQNATLRLRRALDQIVPESANGYFNLAAVQMRRELIDLARHYFGPQGPAAHHSTERDTSNGPGEPHPAPEATDTHDPHQLASWTEFHRQVELLPVEHREVFDLLWYQGLSQAEAAAMLGTTENVVKRRWRAARLNLRDVLKNHFSSL